MSVYTVVSRAELALFLSDYALGSLLDFRGIAAGIENTNYFVNTERGEFVLTLFETTAADKLPDCLKLMEFLASRDFPCARPMANQNGAWLTRLKGKPATLVTRLHGRSHEQVRPVHCRAIGQALATLHQQAAGFPQAPPSERAASWRAQTLAQLSAKLSDAELRMATRLSQQSDEFEQLLLPSGLIHADLFRDNALYDGDELSGIIDFYYAHVGAYVYDLAVLVADWSFVPTQTLNLANAAALIAGYQGVRSLETLERRYWLHALRAVAVRFWLSRLADQHFPRDGAITFTKDPAPFRALVEALAQSEHQFESLLG